MRHYRSILVAGILATAAACADQQTHPLATPDELSSSASVDSRDTGGRPIPDSYIVVLRDDVDAQAVVAMSGVAPSYVYTDVLNGFAATLSAEQVRALRGNPMVKYIEQDQEFSITVNQFNATWGLDRINQRNRPLDGRYSYGYTGSPVYAYVIDTGIRTAHSEFQGRASNVYDAFGGNGQDCNGHGTHVAGTVGGRIYGVAKQVRLRGLRVLNCSGSGSTSGIISAVDWLRRNHVKPAVANLSLGGGYSASLNTAVNNLSNAGVFVVVAAGNSNANACNASPASAANAYTVAASTSSDAKASFSNWGSCVNIYAPGASITSAWHTSNSALNTISGTSMAAPHVAGVAALIKHRYGDLSASSVASYLNSAATANVISGNRTGTPNRLLYKYETTW